MDEREKLNQAPAKESASKESRLEKIQKEIDRLVAEREKILKEE